MPSCAVNVHRPLSAAAATLLVQSQVFDRLGRPVLYVSILSHVRLRSVHTHKHRSLSLCRTRISAAVAIPVFPHSTRTRTRTRLPSSAFLDLVGTDTRRVRVAVQHASALGLRPQYQHSCITHRRRRRVLALISRDTLDPWIARVDTDASVTSSVFSSPARHARTRRAQASARRALRQRCPQALCSSENLPRSAFAVYGPPHARGASR